MPSIVQASTEDLVRVCDLLMCIYSPISLNIKHV